MLDDGAMAGITLEHAEQQLALYLAAEAAVLARQSYTIAGRTMTFADLAAIQQGVKLWDERCSQLSAKASGRGRVSTPRPNF